MRRALGTWLLAGLASGPVLLAGSAPARAADSTWAVFDSQKAMESTTHFKDAKAALEKELQQKQAKLEAKKKELGERRGALDAKRAVAASSALDQQESALVQEEQQLAQLFLRAQRELALYEQKLKEQLFVRLEAAVQEVASRRDHTFVVDAAKVLFHRPSIDITTEVIQTYTKRFGDKPLDLTAVKLSQRDEK